MEIYKNLKNIISEKGAGYLILIDPDNVKNEKLPEFLNYCENAGVDGLLTGGSLMLHGDLREIISKVKEHSNLPVIIFPGSVSQVTPNADAILFISLISGRNAELLIGKHILAAPFLKKYNLEAISTGYMLIESGSSTTAEYISGSNPIPRNKPEIAAATALAAEYLGMKMVYLEAGSGARENVPNEMVKLVSSQISIPLIVGGGIRSAQSAREKVENGANIIVTGNYFEDENNWTKIKEFADAVHIKNSIIV
ncbi:MAG: geranylgeranylglyceryl/heptaprenylglyceryl phosphate synthase [Ignavibacteria bacterium]|jgi:putative glycerol-1-phosphate prenyltransferase